MTINMKVFFLIFFLWPLNSFSEEKFYSVSGLFRTNNYVFDYKPNIDYKQYIPEEYLQITKGSIPVDLIGAFKNNEFYLYSSFRFENEAPEVDTKKVVHFINSNGIRNEMITGIVATIHYRVNREVTKVLESKIFGSFIISSNEDGFAFVSDKKQNITIEPIDLNGLKLTGYYDGEFIVGSKGYIAEKSYLARNSSNPSNSFIYLELGDNPEDVGLCGFKAFIISNTPERKQLNQLYTSCDI